MEHHENPAMTATCLVLAAWPALSAACGERAPEGATLIRATRLYVAPDARRIDDAADPDRRRQDRGGGTGRGNSGAAAPRASASCDGGTVAAGFQNSHVHFTEAKFADAQDRPAAELTAAMTDMLNRYGFTTVVDTASNLANTVALRGRVESGEVPGPRILTAGCALYPKDGIPIYLRDLPPEVLASSSQPASVEEALAERAGEPRWRRGRDQALPDDAAGRWPLRIHAAGHRARGRGRDAPPRPARARAPDRHRGHQPRDRGGRRRPRAHDDRRGQDGLGAGAHRAAHREEHGARADAAALSLRAEAREAADRASSISRRAMPWSRCARSRRRAARSCSAPTSAT